MKKNLPKLPEAQCEFTSTSTYDYNCVGLAVGDYRWWQADERDEYFWPDGVPRDYWASSYVQALETVHFEQCQSGDPEEGYEKVAIFHNGGLFTHVAAIVEFDSAKSKLGEYEDISHPLRKMEGGAYGKILIYLRRPLKFAGEPLPDQYRL